jgi:hypothetical protein
MLLPYIIEISSIVIPTILMIVVLIRGIVDENR